MTDSAVNRLVERLRRGDERAFDELYDLTYRAVFASAYSVLRDKMRAEDVMQDTFVTAYGKLSSYEAGTNFFAWLTTISRRLAINEYHRGKRETAVDPSNIDFARRVDFDETKNWLFELARSELTEEEFEILTLSAVCGYKRREIAAMKQLPVSTVSWKYKKAAERLKELVKREYGK